MSTTGFGSQVGNVSPEARSGTQQQSSFAPISSPQVANFAERPTNTFEVAQPSAVRFRRPPPKFDMSLRDLFPDDIDQKELAAQSFTRPPPRFPPSQSSMPAPPQPGFQPSVAQQQQAVNTQINAGLGIHPTQANRTYFPYSPAPQQIPGGPSGVSQYAGDGQPAFDLSSLPGLDFLNSAEFRPRSDSTGFDIGFGPGLDFQNDWSDGNGVDLFDGFFFGNTGV